MAGRIERRTSAKSSEELQKHILELEERLAEAEETLHALRSGEVDAVIVSGSEGDHVYTLQGADQTYRLFVQEMAEGAITLTPDGLIAFSNEQFAAMLGIPIEQVIGSRILAFVDEDNASILSALLWDDAIVKKREMCFTTSTGDAVPAYVSVNRLRQGAIDCICVVVTDLTQTKARELLAESERQFRTLAETIPNLAWMADEAGNIFWYNRRWYDYTGATFEDMQGWGWQKVHDPAVLPNVLSQWTRSIATGEPFQMVFPLKGADAEFRDFLTRVEPIKDNKGSVVRWFGTNTDITDQKKTEEELRKMNRELEEFAYVASHDLQEPLRMVNIYSHLLLKHFGGEDVKLSNYAGFIRQGVSRMEGLIRDLLTFSRTVHSDNDLPVGAADLSVSFAEALGVLKDSIEDNHAVISVQPLPAVRGDTAQMAHVFQNLLSNALKYRKKDVPPEIHVSAELKGRRWVVSVNDNGIGFEPQYADRIFGLFKRLHKDEYPGTGLGLAICQRIVERYGGRIWAEGRPGEGATFSFSLLRRDSQ